MPEPAWRRLYAAADLRAPAISVVVPTHARPRRLPRLVDALAAQALDPGSFEVLIVDDGSSPPVAEAVVAPLRAAGVEARLIRSESARGPAAARNRGWRAARASLVAFTDDDCRPQPGWLAALLARAAAEPRTVVQGLTVPDPEDGTPGPFDRTQLVDGPALTFETCNIAYPIELLERVGGFDESFRWPCGEDVDLGWRVRAAGGASTFDYGALVHHAVLPTSTSSRLREAWHAVDNVRVLRTYPGLRCLLVHRIFWKDSHPPALAALLLALAAWAGGGGRRRLALAALAPAAPALHHLRRYRANRWPSRRLAADVPRHLATDLVELAAMLRGSVRHRTLVL